MGEGGFAFNPNKVQKEVKKITGRWFLKDTVYCKIKKMIVSSKTLPFKANPKHNFPLQQKLQYVYTFDTFFADCTNFL